MMGDRVRPFAWDAIELVGLALLVYGVYRIVGFEWALLAAGVVLILIANVRGR